MDNFEIESLINAIDNNANTQFDLQNLFNDNKPINTQINNHNLPQLNNSSLVHSNKLNQCQSIMPHDPVESVSSNEFTNVNIPQIIRPLPQQKMKSQKQIPRNETTENIIQKSSSNYIFNIFGYGLPSSTFYFIIVLLIISVCIYLLTSPKTKDDDVKKE